MAVDVFLKIEGVDGESQDSKHKDQMDIYSYSWGLSQSGTMHAQGGGGAGKANFQDMSISMPISKASAVLALACATGKHFPEAKLTCRKAGDAQYDYLTYTMTDVIISSYQTGGSSEVPVDSVSLNFAKIVSEYFQQDAKGEVSKAATFGYDIKKNVKV
jgi:type VI secretion system secreted protein Hcp